jgi:hypothetical protein
LPTDEELANKYYQRVLKTGSSCAGMAGRERRSEDQNKKIKASYMKQNQSSLSPPITWFTMVRNGGSPSDRNSGSLCSVTSGSLLTEICNIKSWH